MFLFRYFRSIEGPNFKRLWFDPEICQILEFKIVFLHEKGGIIQSDSTTYALFEK